MSNLMRVIKRNKFVKDCYRKFNAKLAFSPDGILKAVPTVDEDNPFRANLVLLGIDKDEVFGGVSTAIKIFDLITEKLSCKSRIIVTGNQKLSPSTYIPPMSSSSEAPLLFLEENQNIKVGINDFFIFTYWSTWFSLDDVLDFLDEKGSGVRPRDVYLIQDFEPGFFPWSTEYLLAESTYRNRSNETIALINSHELAEFISRQNYHFFSSHAFLPMLNSSLKTELLGRADRNVSREKIILVYGRPSARRNAFELLVSALRSWSESFPNASDWKIISLGEKHEDIQLSNNRIVSYGKVSLEEYAELMLKSYAGVSLMASPHPSYPPLEMSAFGVKVITNTFANKSLSGFSPNLYTLEICTPASICSELSSICCSFSEQNITGESQVSCPDEYLSSVGLEKVLSRVCADIKSYDKLQEGGGYEIFGNY